MQYKTRECAADFTKPKHKRGSKTTHRHLGDIPETSHLRQSKVLRRQIFVLLWMSNYMPSCGYPITSPPVDIQLQGLLWMSNYISSCGYPITCPPVDVQLHVLLWMSRRMYF